MMKVYQLHETEYRRMRDRGIASWGERNHTWAVDPHDVPFLEDLLQQGWMPSRRRILEVGCGTGPLLRWFAERGFEGLGIDVSETAIQMAREQSEGCNVSYRVADVCSTDVDSLGPFDLCVDGGAVHCLTDPHDRRKALARIYTLLRPDGVFVLRSMCAPINRKNFRRLYPDQKIVNSIVYVPAAEPAGIAGVRRIGGRDFMPVRTVKHWRTLFTELCHVGFVPTLIRLNVCTTDVSDEPVSSLNIAALTNSSTRTV